MDLVTLRKACNLLDRPYSTAHHHVTVGHVPTARRAGGVFLVTVNDLREALDRWQSPAKRNAADQQIHMEVTTDEEYQ